MARENALESAEVEERGSRRANPIDVHVGSRVRFRRMLLGMSQRSSARTSASPSSKFRSTRRASTASAPAGCSIWRRSSASRCSSSTRSWPCRRGARRRFRRAPGGELCRRVPRQPRRPGAQQGLRAHLRSAGAPLDRRSRARLRRRSSGRASKAARCHNRWRRANAPQASPGVCRWGAWAVLDPWAKLETTRRFSETCRKRTGAPCGTQILPVHERVRFRGPPRQGLRPHLRRGRRSVLPRGPQGRHRPLAIRAACETLATTNQVVIAGETRGPETITKDWIAHVARMAIKDIGYEQDGFHWDKADIEVLLHPQSADIAAGVDACSRRQQGRRRRRPGHHVRLRLQRDARADAGADLLRHKILHDLASARHKKEGGAACSAPTPRAR